MLEPHSLGIFTILSYKERQRIKAKDALRAQAAFSKKGIWRSITYSSVTATIALLISGISAYYANFYQHRALLLAVSPTPPYYAPGFDAHSIVLTPIISNSGNHTEVVISVSLAIGHSVANSISSKPPMDVLSTGVLAGPFILKSADAITVRVSFPLVETPPPPKEQEVYIRVAALSPHDDIIAVDIPVMHLTLNNPPYPEGSRMTYTEHISAHYEAGLIRIFSYPTSEFWYSGETGVQAMLRPY